MSEGMSEKENIEIVKKILEAGFQNLLIFLVVLTVCGDHLHRDHHHHDHHHRDHHHHDHHHRDHHHYNLQVYVKLLDWWKGD